MRQVVSSFSAARELCCLSNDLALAYENSVSIRQAALILLCRVLYRLPKSLVRTLFPTLCGNFFFDLALIDLCFLSRPSAGLTAFFQFEMLDVLGELPQRASWFYPMRTYQSCL